MVWGAHTGVRLERWGVPAAVVSTTGFADMGRDTAESLGLEGLCILAAPHPFDTLTPAGVSAAAEALLPEIERVLTAPAEELAKEYRSKSFPQPEEGVLACSLPHGQ
ncbi:MAG: hypothetical protein HYX97_04280 [Chloroflexi bacterium]|nr:hypothetical protein [Chloroflexota bacterium]